MILQDIKLEEEKPYSKPECGIWRKYSVNRKLDDSHNGGFWKLSDLPEGVKKIKGYSNGSIVDCYVLNDGGNPPCIPAKPERKRSI